MTAVWEAITLFWRWRERALLSQPIILALNISRENNVSFRLKEQRIWKAERIAPKETWLTYEPNSSWADRQQSPDAKRRAGDMAPAIWESNLEETRVHAPLPCFLPSFTSVHRKTWFSSYQIPARLTNILIAKAKVRTNECFCQLLQFLSAQSNHFTQTLVLFTDVTTYYCHVLFQTSVAIGIFVC